MTTTKSTKLASLGRRAAVKPLALAFTLVLATLSFSATPALAAGEAHPKIGEFGHNATEAFSNPNGIAVEESTGDVYVADIGTNMVYKFDASGKPVNFSALGSNALTHSFSFPSGYGSPAAIAVDNACVQHTPALTGKACEEFDPSAGDLYVMDAGHDAIDKFGPSGEYLSQIGGLPPVIEGEGELLGLGVDGSGTVHVDLSAGLSRPLVEEFDSAAMNHLVARQEWVTGTGSVVSDGNSAHGFAVSATGDDYLMFGPSCSCTVKFGQRFGFLGSVDGFSEAGDVAVAVDPATGELYADDQSSVAEWATGAMNRNSLERKSAGTLVARFGSLQLSNSAGDGGIAVDGKSGEIYVSNPGEGNPGEAKVYVFGSDAPAVTAGEPTDVTREAASLSGTVDPRGVEVSECKFEYGVTDEWGNGPYNHSVPCEQTPEAGSGPVAVSAQLEGLVAGELYHFHLVATNANGAGEGSGMLATQGVGFGIKEFEVNFINENGTPDTQAGSHPYQFVNYFKLNSHFERMESNADSPYIRVPVGVLRNLKIDLPPGFVGDPNASARKCTGQELRALVPICPPESIVGEIEVHWSEDTAPVPGLSEYLFNMVPPHGVALQLGANFFRPLLSINNGVLAGGDYPVQATVTEAPPAAPVITSKVKIFGVSAPCKQVPQGTGKYSDFRCTEAGAEGGSRGEYEREPGAGKAFLTMPTGCHGPLRSTMEAESWEEPGKWVKASAVTHNAAGAPVSLTGCSKLKFLPEIGVAPDTTDASTSSGLTVNVHVPQGAALNPEGLAESSLRDTTVALPAGVAINPSGGGGLEACSEGLAGFEIGHGVNGSGFEEFNKAFEPGVLTPTFTPTAIESLQPGLSFCPNGSKIGEVTIHTPLLPNPLKGFVYLASQGANPFGSLLSMYLMVEDPISGSTVKLTGEVQLCKAAGEVIDGMSCQGLGQIVTTFKNTPDVPFENLELHFFGGERAPLATPTRCGTYTTIAVFTPWDGNGPVNAESSFKIDHGPGGGPCPGASLPFSPTVTGGATNIQAGAFSPLTVTMNRKDGEQNLKSIVAKLPPGLSGVLTGVELCPEPQANLGECPPNSLIGEATIAVGVGNQPFTVTGGKFYLTGPYNGSGACTVGTLPGGIHPPGGTPSSSGCAPFGLTFEVPAKAGPFDLANTKNNHPACDCVVVRGKIELNPLTAAITITSDPPGSPYSIPTSIEGIPLEIQHVNATTTRGDFQFNPTNCAKMALEGTVQLSEGGTSTVSTPFQVTNCEHLKFEPKFSVSTSGKTSRSKGASLTAKLTYPKAPFGSQANIARVKVDLPKQLPSRLTTLQKACTAAQFNANPAGCPAASFIGHAKAITPILPVPLEGPAIFVSHGGEAFPSLIVVLQGYGVTIDLVGSTFISKAGITSSTFKTVPDQPVTSFELTLPEGKYSALAANGNLCAVTKTVTVKKKVTVRVRGRKKTVTRKVKETQPATLSMPTEFVAQNGAEIHQTTPISVTGCTPAISVVSHSVSGRTATVVVSVPSAGKLVATAHGLSKGTGNSSKAQNVTVNLTLTNVEQAFLNHHKGRKLEAKIHLTFTPKKGSKLRTTTTVLIG
jgi:DNA-binding beta-propeller fold protein YncE/ribosomal protein L11